MKLKVEEVNIERVNRNQAIEIMNELKKALGDDMVFSDKYPHLHELYKLLTGAFISVHHNIHFISKHQ